MDLASAGQQVSRRFHVVNAIPISLVVVYLFILISSGAYGDGPSLAALRHSMRELTIVDVAFGTFAVLVLSVAANSFQTRLVKIYEGYWKPAGIGGVLREAGLQRHAHLRSRWSILQSKQATPTGWQAACLHLVPEDRRDQVWKDHRRWARARHRFYPPRPSEADARPDRLMPTRLGNALRRAEDRAGDRYGIDAVAASPYIYIVSSAPTRSLLEDARTELDAMVRLSASFLVCTLASLTAFANDGPWLLSAPAAFLLAWSSYLAAIRAAEGYGQRLIEAVDLHRFDVMRQLHWPLPGSTDDERATQKAMWTYVNGDAMAEDWAFDHG